MINWLFKKYPREKKVCKFCGGCFGLARPNFPYCSGTCKDQDKPPDQHEMDLEHPPDELVKLLRYP